MCAHTLLRVYLASRPSPFRSPQLRETIEAELIQSGLQVTPFTLTKVIQLYETKNSRHSTMIVGKTGCGKSVTWRTLQSTLATMHRQGEPGFNLVRVGSSTSLADWLLLWLAF